MQAELSRPDEQLARALEGEAWHGPSVLEALEGVSAEQAAAHPIAGAHSIWELVLHLCGTYGLVLRRLGGDGRQLTETGLTTTQDFSRRSVPVVGFRICV